MGEYNGPDPGYAPMAGVNYGNGQLVMPDPNAQKVTFFSRAKLMPAQSKDTGRQVWENVEYVRVQQPTEKYPIELEAHDGHRQRWQREYQAFLQGREAMPDGTPLSILLPGNEAAVNELKGMSIFTIEQMASVSDSVIHRVPFGNEMKTRAKRYIEAMSGAQGFNKVQGELDKANARAAEVERMMEEMKEEITAIRSTPPVPALDPNIAALLASLAASQAQPKTRRGRPPKVTQPEAMEN